MHTKSAKACQTNGESKLISSVQCKTSMSALLHLAANVPLRHCTAADPSPHILGYLAREVAVVESGLRATCAPVNSPSAKHMEASVSQNCVCLMSNIDSFEAMKGKIVPVQVMQCYSKTPLVLPDTCKW